MGERLAWVPGGLAFTRMRAAYALLASGLLVDAAQAEAGMQPGIQMETSTFLLSALQRQPDPSAAEALRREVADELERSAQLDREPWLKVSREAPRAELERRSRRRWSARLLEAGGHDGLKNDLEESSAAPPRCCGSPGRRPRPRSRRHRRLRPRPRSRRPRRRKRRPRR